MKHLVIAIAPSLALAATLGACAAPATRISDGLQRYGFDPARSNCIGERLQSNLSLGQLQQLGRAANAYGKDDPNPNRFTADDLIRVAGQIEDPKVALEVGKAVAGCSV